MDNTDDLIKIESNGAKGLALESGTTIISPRYEDIRFPRGGFIMIKLHGKWGICDLDENIKLPCNYKNIYTWNNKYIVVRCYSQEDTGNNIGVVDWTGKTIIAPEYANISLTDYDLFKCYSTATKIFDGTINDYILDSSHDYYVWKNKYNSILGHKQLDPYGYSSIIQVDGGLILDNALYIDSDLDIIEWTIEKNIKFIKPTKANTFICSTDGKKFGLRDASGKSLVLNIYDGIREVGNYLVILYGNMLGFLSLKGQLIISPNFAEIYYNVIDESDSTIAECGFGVWKYENGSRFRYSIDKPLKLSSTETIITKAIITTENADRNHNNNTIIHIKSLWYKEPASDIVILKSISGREYLFNLSTGFPIESNYEKIIPLTQSLYILINGDSVSIFNSAKKEIILSNISNLIYYGGGIVFYEQDSLWGATLLDKDAFTIRFEDRLHKSWNQIDIPCKYKAIRPLKDSLLSYEVQVEQNYYNDENATFFKIINADNKVIVGERGRYDKPFVLAHKGSLIIASKCGKYGLISPTDEEIVPCKYDEIVERVDGGFNVRIGNSFGLLFKSGFESHIKYSEILKETRYCIVEDIFSNLYGVVDSATGNEIIPCVFEFVVIKNDVIITAKDGCSNYNSLMGWCSETWGCFDLKGNSLVPCKYNYIKIQYDYILAGYNGSGIYIGQDYVESEFSGVYDLYNRNGLLLIGGFSRYRFSKESISLYFGGYWKSYSDEYGYYDYDFVPGVGRWLILNPDMTTLLPDDNGNHMLIPSGSHIRWSTEESENNTIHKINFPLSLLVEDDFFIDDNWITAKNRQQLIRIKDNFRICGYKKVKALSDDMAFVMTNDYKVGLINGQNQFILPPSFFAFTYPVGHYCLGVIEENDKYNVYLYDLESRDINNTRILIYDTNDIEDIKQKLYFHYFLFYCYENSDDLKSYFFEHGTKWMNEKGKSLFSNHRAFRIRGNQTVYYWFSYSEMRYVSTDDNYLEERDLLGDSWDAMTDGMYGDCPENFGGDFGFLGR